jgi:tRNA(His) 5'-end guanylyltransferase
MSKFDKDSLGTRMKRYEDVNRYHLSRRTPVIIRLDGKAFHNFTKDLDRPFDDDLHITMTQVTFELTKEIQGAVFAYTQSDEISILLRDWDTVTTDAWFDYNIQKMASVSASIATMIFNNIWKKSNKKALFDSRVFNLPKEEVCNYFIWRQQDATRNSINMLGRYYFSHNQLQGKNTKDIMDMLVNIFNINWNDLDTWKKRGTCCSKINIDNEIPIFTQDRNYIEQHLL